MVLSVHRFTKFYSKIENHHHHHRKEALQASLQAFRSDVSSSIPQLLYNLKPGIFEIPWIHQCFQVLPVSNKAFAKLVVEIDYHMTHWQAKSMEDYLNYSLELLDHFNSINASISHLSHTRVSLLHALSLLHTSPSSAAAKLKAVEFEIEYLRKKIDSKQQNKADKESYSSDNKESVVLQALIELRSVGLWVCRVVSAILSGDEKLYTTKSGEELSNPALIKLDSRVGEILMKKGCFLEEVKELKESSAAIAGGVNSGGEATMEKKLEEFEKQLNDIGKQVELVFSDVLAGRNELLNQIRFTK